MGDLFQFAYACVWAVQGYLVASIYRNGNFRRYPAFATLMSFYLLQFLVLGSALLEAPRYYAVLYWAGRLISLAMCVFVCSEVVRSNRVAVAGLIAYSAFLVFGRHLWMYRWFGFAVCAFMLIASLLPLDRQRNAIATGMAVQFLFSAITDVNATFAVPWLQYVETFAFLPAQFIWIMAFRTKAVRVAH